MYDLVKEFIHVSLNPGMRSLEMLEKREPTLLCLGIRKYLVINNSS